MPGNKVSFDYEPDFSDLLSDFAKKYINPPKATGSVFNRAGILTLTADIDVILECTCFRCAKDFELPVHKQINAILAEDTNDTDKEHDSDSYFFQGDMIDLDEILRTEYLLNTDERFLCKEDCAGMCQKCGTDLNEGSCFCIKDIDPRLAKLNELLDNQIK